MCLEKGQVAWALSVNNKHGSSNPHFAKALVLVVSFRNVSGTNLPISRCHIAMQYLPRLVLNQTKIKILY